MTTGELTVDVARWLTGTDGLAVVSSATQRLDHGHTELAVGSLLREQGIDPQRAAAATTAAATRRRARARWPDADSLLFTREALEQASDPEVSRWRARRFAADRVWDLCAGVGGDTLALAERAGSVTAVELDPARAVLLAHNAAVRHLDVEVMVADALVLDLPASALVHADPARRRGARRLRRLDDHVPSVPALLERHHSVSGAAVVLSPAVDLDDPGLPADVEVEFVQRGDRLIEAVVWRGGLRTPATAATATLLPDGIWMSRRVDERTLLPVGGVAEHLVEVVPAAVRARLHDRLGAGIGARRLGRRRALLTTTSPPAASPWYRSRPVLDVLPARPAPVRRWLRQHDPGPVEIVLHGVDVDVDTWWRALGRPPRGPRGLRIELVRLDEGAVSVVTDARDDAAGSSAP